MLPASKSSPPTHPWAHSHQESPLLPTNSICQSHPTARSSFPLHSATFDTAQHFLLETPFSWLPGHLTVSFFLLMQWVLHLFSPTAWYWNIPEVFLGLLCPSSLCIHIFSDLILSNGFTMALRITLSNGFSMLMALRITFSAQPSLLNSRTVIGVSLTPLLKNSTHPKLNSQLLPPHNPFHLHLQPLWHHSSSFSGQKSWDHL